MFVYCLPQEKNSSWREILTATSCKRKGKTSDEVPDPKIMHCEGRYPPPQECIRPALNVFIFYIPYLHSIFSIFATVTGSLSGPYRTSLCASVPWRVELVYVSAQHPIFRFNHNLFPSSVTTLLHQLTTSCTVYTSCTIYLSNKNTDSFNNTA